MKNIVLYTFLICMCGQHIFAMDDTQNTQENPTSLMHQQQMLVPSNDGQAQRHHEETPVEQQIFNEQSDTSGLIAGRLFVVSCVLPIAWGVALYLRSASH